MKRPEVVTWPCCGAVGATLRTENSRQLEVRRDTCECGQECVFMFSPNCKGRGFTREQFDEKFAVMGDTIMLREHMPKPWAISGFVRKLLNQRQP